MQVILNRRCGTPSGPNELVLVRSSGVSAQPKRSRVEVCEIVGCEVAGCESVWGFLKICRSLRERCSLSMSTLTSQVLRLPGVGQKFKPLDNKLIWVSVKSSEDIFITPFKLMMFDALPV